MKVTVQMLRDAWACLDQVAIFAKEWPNGIEITEASTARAIQLGLDIPWFAQQFLSGNARAVWNAAAKTAYATFQQATTEAWEIYKRTMWQEPTERARASAAYEKVAKPAGDAWDRSWIEALVLAVETMEASSGMDN